MNSKSSYVIAVVGLWHLGEIFSAGLASIGHKVIGIDDDERIIANLRHSIPPLPEPRLEAMLRDGQSAGRLEFTADASQIRRCDAVWLTADTPIDKNGHPDLRPILRLADKISPHLRNGVLLLISSQIPVGASAIITSRLARRRPGLRFHYAYVPENLRLGEAVGCFLEPERIVVGCVSLSALETVEKIFLPLKTKIIAMSPASAELSKHALNAFLAASISFANEVADVAERVGADAIDVARALRSDQRIGPRAYLDAGLGYSGWSLVRDVTVLAALAKKYKITPSLMAAVAEKNEARKQLVMRRLQRVLGGFRGKIIVLFGAAYKPGTSALRNSHALEIVHDLLRRGAAVRLHDRHVRAADVTVAGVVFYDDPYEAVTGANALVVMTSSPSFKELTVRRLGERLKPGAFFFDPCNLFIGRDRDLRRAGFVYAGVGRPALTLKKHET